MQARTSEVLPAEIRSALLRQKAVPNLMSSASNTPAARNSSAARLTPAASLMPSARITDSGQTHPASASGQQTRRQKTALQIAPLTKNSPSGKNTGGLFLHTISYAAACNTLFSGTTILAAYALFSRPNTADIINRVSIPITCHIHPPNNAIIIVIR